MPTDKIYGGIADDLNESSFGPGASWPCSSRVTPRIFRRTLATHWRGNLKGLLAQGGWKDVSTPQVHYQQHRTSQHDLDYDALMEPEEGRETQEVDDDTAYR